MRLFIGLLSILSAIHLSSQHRIAVYELDRTLDPPTLSFNQVGAYLDNVSSYIIESYAGDDRFIIIDKANEQIIKEEQDRQKSEEFIDGYIVEQGAQEGFDYCYYPKYDRKEKLLSVKVYDIAKGTVISHQETKIKSTLIGTPKNLRSSIIHLVEKINADCFEIRYEIVRCIDKKKKAAAKDLLFAIGSSQRAKKKQEFDIYYLAEEKTGGKTIERKEFIGKGKIEQVEDANFSTLRVSKGGEAIMAALTAGTQLYGSIKAD